jgi:signal transduction histidine kinase
MTANPSPQPSQVSPGAAEASDMWDKELLLLSRTPTRAQVRTVVFLAVVIGVVVVVSLLLPRKALFTIVEFVPVYDTIMMLGFILNASMLFAQAPILRSRGLLALATGFLFMALITIPHAITYPYAFPGQQLLPAGLSTPTWLVLFMHTGFAIAVLAYAALKTTDARHPMRHLAAKPAITLCISGCVLLVILLTVLATRAGSLLPALMTSASNFVPSTNAYFNSVPLVLTVWALLAILRKRPSVLDLWLALALWCWIAQLLIASTITVRFSASWYMARIAGLLSGAIIPVVLVSATNRVYAQHALLLTMQRREREGRLLTMNAVATAMAHEIKQPLTSIVANAGAGIATASRAAADDKHTLDLFQLIEEEGHRAAETVDSIRAMFVDRPSEKAQVNINELVRETAALVGGELKAWQVMLQLLLEDRIPSFWVDRLQMQHVLLNLLTNAIEAMTAINDRPRVLVVRSTLNGGAALITVEDSGTGIESGKAGRIFDAFFTTKPHGTGMGLSLARAIIESHGGRIWATSGQQFGATFHVQLPLSSS